jgi:type I restriction enzyme S subunit
MKTPDSWKKGKIGDVVVFEGGTQPPQRHFVYQPIPGYVRMLQIRDYKSDRYATYIPAALAKNSCDAEDVMIGRYGPPIFQILRGKAGAYNVALIKATPDHQRMTKDYLHLVLQQDSLFRLIDTLSRRSAGQAGVDMDALRSFPLALPPLPEQRGIAGVLSRWDRAIEQTTALIAAKDRLKQCIMQEQFSKGDDSKRISQSPLRHLGDVVTESAKRNTKGLGNDSVYSVTKANGMVPMHEDVIGSDIARYKLVSPKAFAYNPMRINIGSIARWEGNDEVLVSPDYVVFECGPELDPDYLNHFRRGHIWESFVKRAGDGSVRVRIYFADLSRMRMNIPSIQQQRRIARILNEADTELGLLRSKLKLLQQQKRGLMQQLLTGRVRVSDRLMKLAVKS